MHKLNGNQTKQYLGAMKNVNGISFDELVGDGNPQQAKSRIRQSIHQLLDSASVGKKRILISIGD